MKVEVYVEGGGRGPAIRRRCREGFSRFFEKTGLKARMPRIIACGSRNDAYKRFCTAASGAKNGDFSILLVDSENAVTKQPWTHLKDGDGWNRPSNADEPQAQLMVECMESWFLADIDCLMKFFGKEFARKHVKNSSHVESISKNDVFTALKMATRKCPKCKKTGGYDKGSHSFDVLGRIDPAKVRNASKHADRLLKTLNEKC